MYYYIYTIINTYTITTLYAMLIIIAKSPKGFPIKELKGFLIKELKSFLLKKLKMSPNQVTKKVS